MPIHDWSRVDAGLFQSFRRSWISTLSSALNGGLLPDTCYALLAPAAVKNEEILAAPGTVPFRMPWLDVPADDDLEYYRLRKSHVVIRRSDDHTAVAVLDIVSAGDRASRAAIHSFAERCVGLIHHRVHLLLCDILPPDQYAPQGIHQTIWHEFDAEQFELPPRKPFTLAAYECDLTTRAYIEPVAVGDALPDMPLFLEPNGCVMVPLQATYQTAYAVLPRRWQRVLEAPSKP